MRQKLEKKVLDYLEKVNLYKTPEEIKKGIGLADSLFSLSPEDLIVYAGIELFLKGRVSRWGSKLRIIMKEDKDQI